MFKPGPKRQMKPYTPDPDPLFADSMWTMKIIIPEDRKGRDLTLPGLCLEPGKSEADKYMIMCFRSFGNERVPVNLYTKELECTGDNLLADAPGIFSSGFNGNGYSPISDDAHLGSILIRRARFIRKAAPRGMIVLCTTAELRLENPHMPGDQAKQTTRVSDFLRAPKPMEEPALVLGVKLSPVVLMPMATGFEEEEDPAEPAEGGNEIVFDIATKQVVNKDKTGQEE